MIQTYFYQYRDFFYVLVTAASRISRKLYTRFFILCEDIIVAISSYHVQIDDSLKLLCGNYDVSYCVSFRWDDITKI